MGYLVIEQAVQLRAGAKGEQGLGCLAFHGADRAPQDSCRLGLGQVIEVAQHDHGSLSGLQSTDRPEAPTPQVSNGEFTPPAVPLVHTATPLPSPPPPPPPPHN